MQVILLQDVAKLGRRFDVVTVPDGYGLNKLVPQGMAQVASPENVKRVKAQAAKTESDRAVADEAYAAVVAQLKDVVVVVKAEASEEGKLYQAIKDDEIIAAALAQTGVTIEPAWVTIKTPIKQTGEAAVDLTSGEVTTAMQIMVEAA